MLPRPYYRLLPGPFGSLVRFAFLGLLLTTVSFSSGPAGAEPLPDPVERFREALDGKGDLEARARDLHSLGDLSRALVLKEWQVGSTTRRGEAWDRVRKDLTDRFQKGIREVVAKGTREERLGVAALVGETASVVRVLKMENSFYRGVFSPLVPDLIALTGASQPEDVREAATQALGKVQGDQKLVGSALKRLLGQDNSPRVRLAAAEALSNLVQVASLQRRNDFVEEPLMPIRTARISDLVYLLRTADLVVPLAGEGLDPRQPDSVRRASVEVFHVVTATLQEWNLELTERYLPPSSPPSTPEARSEEDRYKNLFPERDKELLQLLKQFQRQAKALAGATLDRGDSGVRIAARQVLEELILFRRQLREISPPAPPEEKKSGATGSAAPLGNGIVVALGRPVALGAAIEQAPEQPADPVGEALRTVLPALREGLSDPNAEGRLAAVNVLETIGPDAAPAVPELVERLTDPYKFVRWAAARTLGRLKLDSKRVVPALARLLKDPDFGLRLAAATALENYGPQASPAVPDLLAVIHLGVAPDPSPWPTAYSHPRRPIAREVYRGDPEVRMASMRALRAIGTDATKALPDIGRTLQVDPDARVRRTAAEVLGAFGALAKAEAPALRQRLNDSDVEVRRATSEALLRVLGK
jgi:HEAT repeat protein